MRALSGVTELVHELNRLPIFLREVIVRNIILRFAQAMRIRIYTEEELARLRDMPKRVTTPRTRWLEKPKARPVHQQRSYQAVGQQQDEETRFEVYQR